MIAGAVIFCGALAAAVILTPAVGRLARATGAVDMPGARKVHHHPIPRIGGVVFVVAMMVVGLPALLVGSVHVDTGTATMLAAAACMFVVGLLDDIVTVSPKLKFLSLLAAAIAVCAAGGRLDRLDLGAGLVVNLGLWGWPVTLVWIIGVTVGFNFIDGLDGLAAGIAAITCGVLWVVAVASGQPALAMLMLCLLGALVGFLLFNFNPASIFMGDCGSMFLGFTLASTAALCAGPSRSFTAIALPAVALGVPIVDTVFTFIRRGILERRSIFTAERGHIHHRLLSQGVSHRQAVILIYAVTLGVTGLGTLMLITRGVHTLLILVNLVVLLLVLFHWLGSLRVDTLVAAVRRNLRIRRLWGRQRRDFEDVQLKLRIAKQFDTWWADLCEAAEKMHFTRMALTLTNRDGHIRTLRWEAAAPDSSPAYAIQVAIPVRQRRAGPPLHLEVDLVGDGSLEAATHALEYFSRLLDEHSLADLPQPDT